MPRLGTWNQGPGTALPPVSDSKDSSNGKGNGNGNGGLAGSAVLSITIAITITSIPPVSDSKRTTGRGNVECGRWNKIENSPKTISKNINLQNVAPGSLPIHNSYFGTQGVP